MDIFKIIGVGLIGGILSMTVKQYKKEYALLVALATVTVILFFTIDTLETAISQISLITEKSGVDTRYFTASSTFKAIAPSPPSRNISAPNCVIYATPTTFITAVK